MADELNVNRFSDLVRMARQHAESLRAAGVEWLPIADASPEPAAQAKEEIGEESLLAPRAESEVSHAPQSLFDAPAPPTMSADQKRVALQMLDEQHVKGCPRCPELVRARSQTVFGVGNPAAELCFVGEAPGAEEDAQGEPFVGQAGKLLDRIIVACKMKRDDVYICNVLKCRPPGNRTPLPNESANCRPFLEQQLEIIRPKFICALGAVAAQWLLDTTQSIGKLRGRFHDYRGIPVLCTYHPAYLLRNPAAKRDVWDDMKKLMSRMGRPVD